MQTLFAVAALTIAMVVALTVHRSHTGLVERRVDNEVDTVALGVAAEHLNRASLLPFDEAKRVLDVANLTPPIGFGGAAAWEMASDLDDLHGLTEEVEVSSPGRALTYAVSAEVHYVRLVGAAFAPADAQTPYKELVVTVTGPGGRRAELSRVYGCRFNA